MTGTKAAASGRARPELVSRLSRFEVAANLRCRLIAHVGILFERLHNDLFVFGWDNCVQTNWRSWAFHP